MTIVKRCLDFVSALILLALFAPVMLVLAVTIACTMGRPVLFRQRRPGRSGRVFTLYKLRTMADTRGPDGRLLPDLERLTGIGRFIRATSLDELPQLWNVAKGDMSLVGPRPLLTEYLDRYTARQARRHEVRPGITGWAQVNGRNAISWEEKFELDIWYVDHRSFALDMRILLLTLVRVVRRDGISHGSEATIAPFVGNRLSDAENGDWETK